MLWLMIRPLPALPYYIWEGETTEERNWSEAHLDAYNKEKEHLTNIYIDEACGETQSQPALQVFNERILAEKRNEERAQRTYQYKYKERIQKTPAQVFKTRKFKRDNKAGGVDAYLYSFNILIPRLIPYIRRVQAYASTVPYKPRVVLIKDNVDLHKLAWKMVPPDVKQGIDRIDYWPPYSPELNMIEPCWKHLKKEIPSLEIPHLAA